MRITCISIHWQRIMKITLTFHGNLKKYNDGKPEQELELAEESAVARVLGQVTVPKDEIAFVAVNGSRVPLTHSLKEGDAVKLFQLVGGG